jgi:diguanylate cyclase (GGDEF)-like protein
MAHSYRRLAYEDPITRGPNRRAFDERLAFLADSAEAPRATILMLDLDRFKQVNDNFGHAAGDTVLRKVFEAVEASLRDGDFAARLGGDEFASLLPHTGSAAAEKVAGRILAAVRSIGGAANLTATIGLAPLCGGPRQAMLEADLALYRAKADGGDSVGVADQE